MKKKTYRFNLIFTIFIVSVNIIFAFLIGGYWKWIFLIIGIVAIIHYFKDKMTVMFYYTLLVACAAVVIIVFLMNEFIYA